jgi:hypothetical protein
MKDRNCPSILSSTIFYPCLRGVKLKRGGSYGRGLLMIPIILILLGIFDSNAGRFDRIVSGHPPVI